MHDFVDTNRVFCFSWWSIWSFLLNLNRAGHTPRAACSWQLWKVTFGCSVLRVHKLPHRGLEIVSVSFWLSENFEWQSIVDFWGKMCSTFLNYNICYLMSAGGLFFQTSRTYLYKIKWYAPENYCKSFSAFLYLGSSYDAGPLSPSFHLLWICKGCCVWQLH